MVKTSSLRQPVPIRSMPKPWLPRWLCRPWERWQGTRGFIQGLCSPLLPLDHCSPPTSNTHTHTQWNTLRLRYSARTHTGEKWLESQTLLADEDIENLKSPARERWFVLECPLLFYVLGLHTTRVQKSRICCLLVNTRRWCYSGSKIHLLIF